MSRKNYKVHADIGVETLERTRVLAILDTGAGPNFIRTDKLPVGYEAYLKPGPLPDICDANANPIDMNGVITLKVEIGGFRLSLKFIICNRLSTECILGTDFCDRFVEAKRPKKKLVELENVTEIRIVRNPRGNGPKARVG